MNCRRMLYAVVVGAWMVGAGACTGDRGPTGPEGPQGADGTTGPAGPQGPAGPAGSANVTTYLFHDLEWGFATHSIILPITIREDIRNEGLVLVYVRFAGAFPNTWHPVPSPYIAETNGPYSVRVMIGPDAIGLVAMNPDGTALPVAATPPDIATARVVLVPAATVLTQNVTTADLLSFGYQDAMAALGLPE